MNGDNGCPVCNSSHESKERFARMTVAEHIKEKARHDEDHQEWIDKNTDNGSLSEIRNALNRQRSD